MLPSNHIPNPSSTDNCHWRWLQARLDSSALHDATQALDDWLGVELQELERNYDGYVTTESRKLVASSVVLATGRK